MKTLCARTRTAWRNWLVKHHDQAPTGIWLVFYKQRSGRPTLDYDAAVEEALCFGWIDSIIKRIDDEKYVRKFTPRRPNSQWSKLNKARVARLLEGGRMAGPGLAAVEAAKRSGTWHQDASPNISFDLPADFAEALAQTNQAKVFFDQLTRSCRKQYLGWVATAKRPETRASRIRESVRLLASGKKLGLK